MTHPTTKKSSKAKYGCIGLISFFIFIVFVAALSEESPAEFNQAAYDAAQENMQGAYDTWPEIESIVCESDCTHEVTYTFSSVDPEWGNGDLNQFLRTVSVGFAWQLVRDHGSDGDTTFTFAFPDQTVTCVAEGGLEVTCL